MSPFFYVICNSILVVYSSKKLIKIKALGSVLETGNGGYILGAQYLLTKWINNQTDILNNDWEIKFDLQNAHNDKTTAIRKSIHFGRTITVVDSDGNIDIPIILGLPTSSLSIAANPILDAYGLAQISSASTSIQLADKTSFPSFYRTVPSDDIQAECIVSMCQHFNWTKIAILYYNDNYGTYLTNKILELGNNINIKSHAISYVANNQSIYRAANTIQKLGVYIIVLIPQNSVIKLTYSILNDTGLMDFPYFYIGVDSWFDTQRIKNSGIDEFTKGFIGVTPWYGGINMIDDTRNLYNQYESNGLGQIYNASVIGYERLQYLWDKEYSDNLRFRILIKNPDLKAPSYHSLYGWDSALAIIHALEIYDKQFNLSSIDGTMSIKNFSDELQIIMKSKNFSFLGNTGHVSFDSNGNRKNGLYTFSNVIDDHGTIQDIGFYHNGSIIGNFSNIIWPDTFNEFEISPTTNKLSQHQFLQINPIAQFILYIACYASMSIVILIFMTMFMYRKNPIIKATAWRLNGITCIGCLLTYTTIILYGQTPTVFLCNLREWLFCICFTLIFMPLFMKTYRVYQIFTSGLNGLNIITVKDGKLVLYIMGCLIIDLLILVIFSFIELKDVTYTNDSIEEIHPLMDCIKIHAVCSRSRANTLIFYIILYGWKSVELLFGVYVVMSVSSIGINRILNETSSQIFGIVFTIFILVIGSIPLLFKGYNDDTGYYATLAVLGLLTGNVILMSNVLPRLIAVYYNMEDKYRMSEQDRIKLAMKKEFKFLNEDYIKNEYYLSKNELYNNYSLKMMKYDLGLSSINESPHGVNGAIELIALEAARSRSINV